MSAPERDGEDGARPSGGARAALLLLALFVLAFAWLELGRDRDLDGEFQLDEAEWISMGVHSWQLARTGRSVDDGATPAELAEAAGDPWREGIQASTFGWMYPGLMKLALGAVAQGAGVETTTRLLYPRFHEGPPRASAQARERLRERFAPALGPSRALMAAFGAGVALLLFLIGRRIAGAFGGGLAYGLWLLSPTVREVAVHVRMDLPPLLFALLALLLVLGAPDALSGARGLPRLVAAASLLGLLCGAAVGTKLNGALVSFCAGPWLLLAWARLPRAERPAPWRPLLALGLAGTVCALLFWASLPALWGEAPIPAVRELLDRWSGSLASQVRTRGGLPAVPADALGRLGLVLRRVTGEFDTLSSGLGVTVGALLAPLGFAALAARALRGGSRFASRCTLVFVVVVVLGTALALKLDQRRLMLPVLAMALLLQGVLVGTLVDLIRARLAPEPPAA